MNKFNKITVCVEGKNIKVEVGTYTLMNRPALLGSQETQWNGCFQGKQTPVQDLDNFKTKKC